MRIFAQYNENGEYLAFYNDEFHKESDIPQPYIELTEEQWQQALSYRCKVENGNHVYLAFTSDEELQKKYAILRSERDALLADCDWTQIPDAPLTTEQKQAWQTYRQELRDLPDTVDINNIIYPTKPE
jgi:hypothetical protein